MVLQFFFQTVNLMFLIKIVWFIKLVSNIENWRKSKKKMDKKSKFMIHEISISHALAYDYHIPFSGYKKNNNNILNHLSVFYI